MSIPNFTQGFPPDNTTLGQTKSTIRDNLDGTFLAFSVDHRDQNESNPGYHQVIHLVNAPGNVNPAPISNAGQLYVRQIISSGNIDETLFYESGGGRITQLTTNIGGPGDTFVSATNGYTTLFGGLILQWGTVNSTATTGQTGFNAIFPNAAFNVQITPRISSPTTHAFSYCVLAIFSAGGGSPPLANGGFSWSAANGPSASSTGFYWTAIGN